MRAGDELVHPVTGERVVFGRTAADTGGEMLELDDHWIRADHATTEHAHPGMQERWEVLRGRVRFRIGGAEWTARAGQVVVAPPGVAHRAWNLGGGSVHLRIRLTPALRWEDAVQRLFTAGGASARQVMRDFPQELAAAGPASLLDARFPAWHFRERHRREVPGATPAAAMAALLGLRRGDLPVTGVLTRVRSPRRRSSRRAAATASWVEEMLRMNFVELTRVEEELVLGAAGRFWRPRGELQAIAGPAEFAAFHRPGFVRAAIGIRARASAHGATLETETRVAATDEAARRAFARYWALVRPGSGIIRRELLAAAARAATLPG